MAVPIAGSDIEKASDYATTQYNTGTGSTNGTKKYIYIISNGGAAYHSTYDSFAVIWIVMNANGQILLSGEVHIQ